MSRFPTYGSFASTIDARHILMYSLSKNRDSRPALRNFHGDTYRRTMKGAYDEFLQSGMQDTIAPDGFKVPDGVEDLVGAGCQLIQEQFHSATESLGELRIAGVFSDITHDTVHRLAYYVVPIHRPAHATVLFGMLFDENDLPCDLVDCFEGKPLHGDPSRRYAIRFLGDEEAEELKNTIQDGYALANL